MREFSTAVKRAQREAAEDQPEEAIEFKVDGETLRAFPPSEGQFAMIASVMTDYARTSDQIAATINFVFGLLDDDSRVHLKRRLFDREDPFGTDEVMEIMDYLIEEWSGRPTERPSGSTSSPPSAGRRSTAHSRRKASTRSVSPSTASAT